MLVKAARPIEEGEPISICKVSRIDIAVGMGIADGIGIGIGIEKGEPITICKVHHIVIGDGTGIDGDNAAGDSGAVQWWPNHAFWSNGWLPVGKFLLHVYLLSCIILTNYRNCQITTEYTKMYLH